MERRLPCPRPAITGRLVLPHASPRDQVSNSIGPEPICAAFRPEFIPNSSQNCFGAAAARPGGVVFRLSPGCGLTSH